MSNLSILGNFFSFLFSEFFAKERKKERIRDLQIGLNRSTVSLKRYLCY